MKRKAQRQLPDDANLPVQGSVQRSLGSQDAATCPASSHGPSSSLGLAMTSDRASQGLLWRWQWRQCAVPCDVQTHVRSGDNNAAARLSVVWVVQVQLLHRFQEIGEHGTLMRGLTT
eukprot:55282-Amphidinium_carterae.1